MTDITNHQLPEKAMKISEVKAMVGLGTSRIYELERDGLFPAQRVFGARSVRWLQSEVLQYIQSRPKATA